MDKYQYVSLDIRSRISSGEYVQGDRLPAIPELCKLYGVSKITIKRAMDDLERMGIVSRRRGSGTFVKALVSETSLHRVFDTPGEEGVDGLIVVQFDGDAGGGVFGEHR